MSKQNIKLKVLVSAYACEPDKGSEPGVGWNWAKQIAKFAETWVITRTNNRETIEKELHKNPISNLHFVYVDLPKSMRFWKKGQRGVHLYYYFWQFAAYIKVKNLPRFDSLRVGMRLESRRLRSRWNKLPPKPFCFTRI